MVKRFGKIGELFTAQYLKDTDSIVGCTQNTFIWAHEKGHQQLAHGKSTAVNLVRMFLSVVGIGALTYFALNANIFALQMFAATFVTNYGLDELYAWVYALRWASVAHKG